MVPANKLIRPMKKQRDTFLLEELMNEEVKTRDIPDVK